MMLFLQAAGEADTADDLKRLLHHRAIAHADVKEFKRLLQSVQKKR